MGVIFRRLSFLLDIYQLAEESLLKKLKNNRYIKPIKKFIT